MHSVPMKGERHCTNLGPLAFIWDLSCEVNIYHVASTDSWPVSSALPVPSHRCYVGNGTEYRGTAKTTVSGHSCLPWNSDLLYQELHVNSVEKAVQLGLGPFSYCRWEKFSFALYLHMKRRMYCGREKGQESLSRCYPCVGKA